MIEVNKGHVTMKGEYEELCAEVCCAIGALAEDNPYGVDFEEEVRRIADATIEVRNMKTEETIEELEERICAEAEKLAGILNSIAKEIREGDKE